MHGPALFISPISLSHTRSRCSMHASAWLARALACTRWRILNKFKNFIAKTKDPYFRFVTLVWHSRLLLEGSYCCLQKSNAFARCCLVHTQTKGTTEDLVDIGVLAHKVEAYLGTPRMGSLLDDKVVVVLKGLIALRKNTKRINAERKTALTCVYFEIARGHELIGAT